MPQTLSPKPKQLLFDKTELIGAFYTRGKDGFKRMCDHFDVCTSQENKDFIDTYFFDEEKPKMTVITNA